MSIIAAAALATALHIGPLTTMASTPAVQREPVAATLVVEAI
jgi:hypothetical protein